MCYNQYYRSVVSIGDMAFNRCGNLSTVVVLSKVVSIGSYAFYGDKALTQISATSDICAAVLKSCSGSCTKVRSCPSSPSYDGLSAWLIAAIVVITATVGAAMMIVLLLRWRSRRTQSVVVGEAIEMHPLLVQLEARAIGLQGEVVSLDPVSPPCPVASATV